MVDDYQWVMDGFEKGLRDYGVTVCAKRLSPGSLQEVYGEYRPDVMVVDLRYEQNRTAYGPLKELLSACPDAKVLFLSQFEDAAAAQRCLQLGALGFITKDCTAKELAKAIADVSAGKVYLTKPLRQKISDGIYQGHYDERDPFNNLSELELDVAMCLADNRKIEEIVDQLGYSKGWINKMVGQVREKLKAERGTDILKLAIKWGRVKI
jgi:two-component system invasion response regulator UvrY